MFLICKRNVLPGLFSQYATFNNTDVFHFCKVTKLAFNTIFSSILVKSQLVLSYENLDCIERFKFSIKLYVTGYHLSQYI